MKTGSQAHFTGMTGVYYIMYQLSARGFHAACTARNAPHLDILVSSEDGEKSLAIQVKTSQHAINTRGSGANRKPNFLGFDLGYKAAKLNRPRVIFAFVDLASKSDKKVAVYLVPSPKVSEWCAPWIENKLTRIRFQPSIEWMEEYREAWHQVAKAVGDPREHATDTLESTQE